METVNVELNASVPYHHEEEFDQRKMSLIGPDLWSNSTNNLLGGKCYHI